MTKNAKDVELEMWAKSGAHSPYRNDVDEFWKAKIGCFDQGAHKNCKSMTEEFIIAASQFLYGVGCDT